MKTKRATDAERHAPSYLAIGVAFFVVTDLLLIHGAWFLDDNQILIAVAVPLSQCSLTTLWATRTRADPVFRFLVPLIGAIASWYVLTRILPWGIGDPASAAWALALATQTLTIVLVIDLGDRGRSLLTRLATRDQGAAGNPSRAPFTFDLRTLMLWTTVIAFALGFTQYARARWRWTDGITDWEFFEAMPIIGVLNALVAVLWLWAIAAGSWRERSTKTAVAVLVIGALGMSMSSVVAWTTGSNAMGTRDWLVLLIAQSVIVASALGMVMIATRKPSTPGISPGTPGVTPSVNPNG